MAGGLLGLKSHMEAQSMQSLSKVADEQEANKRLEDQMDQAKSTQQVSGAASGAMLGFQAGGPWGAAIGAIGGFLLGDLM